MLQARQYLNELGSVLRLASFVETSVASTLSQGPWIEAFEQGHTMFQEVSPRSVGLASTRRSLTCPGAVDADEPLGNAFGQDSLRDTV